MEIDLSQLTDKAYCQGVTTTLVQSYQNRIYRYCVTRLGEELGEEVAQDVFITAWKSLPRFRQTSTVETWLIGIAKYKCAQAYRNRSRRQTLARTCIDMIRQRAHAEVPSVPEHLMETPPPLARLADGLAQLKDDDRILLTLRYTRGLSVTELVEIIGKPEATVRKRLLRALQRLRSLMDASAD